MFALLALTALAALGAVGAAAEDDEPVAKPPPYVGDSQFPTIHGVEDAEQFFWEVQLGPGQELVQVGDRRAEVLYGDGTTAWVITAEQARDATGAEVPTSLEVIAPNLVALTVHHRDGNPAAGGEPFDYPVSAGPPFVAGPSTATYIPGPSAAPTPTCVVPKLTGRTLAASRTKLTTASCKIGAVRGKRGKGVKVVKQFRAPGTVLAEGAKVAVKLG